MGLSFSEKIALRTIRGLLNGTVGKYSPAELQQFIDNNGNLWGITPDGMRQIIRTVKNQFYTYYRKFIDQVETELLIEWLKQDQPFLYEVIMSSHSNYAWYDEQIRTFKKQIEEM